MNSITFPVYHWRTKEFVGYAIMDYRFRCYYKGVPIYLNDHGYPFVYSNDLHNRKLAAVINSGTRSGAADIHRINYWFETGKWTQEGINAIHHIRGGKAGKLDARLENLQPVPWANGRTGTFHPGDYLTEDQMQHRDNIHNRMTDGSLQTQEHIIVGVIGPLSCSMEELEQAFRRLSA